MIFILGFLTGMITALLIFTILAFFRSAIEQRIKVVEKRLEMVGPRPKGAILIPENDIDTARKRIIANNKAAGIDTPIEDLRPR
jgi:hypothetical protein